MDKQQTHLKLSEAQDALHKAQAILDYAAAEGDLDPVTRKILQHALEHVDLAIPKVVAAVIDTLG